MFDGLVDFVKDLGGDMLGPKYWYEEFKEGQARDEARTVRKEDIERDQMNFDRQMEQQSVKNRIEQGMGQGLSLTAAAGMQPSSGGAMSQSVGFNPPQLSRSQNIERDTALQSKILRAQLDGLQLDNLKKSQDIQKGGTDGPDHGGFMPGSKSGSRVVDKPMERTSSYPGRPNMEAGAVSGLGFEAVRNETTGQIMYAPIPSGDVKQRIEDSPYETRNFLRDAVAPYFGSRGSAPPDSALPGWANNWRWNAYYGAWEPFASKKFGFKNKKLDNNMRTIAPWLYKE